MFRLAGSVGAGVLSRSTSGTIYRRTTGLCSRLYGILNVLCGHGRGALSDSVRTLIRGHRRTEGGGS